jgi:hypothetical protein
VLLRCAVLFVALAVGRELSAQTISRDTTFGVGPCRTSIVADSGAWAGVTAEPDSVPRLLPNRLPIPPMFLRDRRGNFRGRVLLSFVVDTAGWVVAGTVGVDESTDARLSEWACKIAVALRYRPAKKGGVVVNALKDQPLSYVFGDPPT